jgi:bacterial/archaeal transporter family protein
MASVGSGGRRDKAAEDAANNALCPPYRQCGATGMIPDMTTSGVTSGSWFSSWFIWALLSAVFAAATAIFAKLGIEGIDSDYATLIRTAIVIVVLSAFVVLAGKWSDPRALSPRNWTYLTLSGLATGASWVCYFRALKVGDASKVAPVDKLSLILVVIFAFAFLGERPSLREWSGIALVAGGVLVLAFRR